MRIRLARKIVKNPNLDRYRWGKIREAFTRLGIRLWLSKFEPVEMPLLKYATADFEQLFFPKEGR